MMKSWGKWALAALLVTGSIAGGTAVPKQAAAFTSANADSAMNAFVNVFYDASAKYFYTNSDHQIHAEHAYGPDGGKYTDFWWEAQLWETVMDAYERTHSSTYRSMIDDIYTGFNAKYTDMMSNDFNDDLGWWALACMRAYELTGTAEYRNRASFLFDQIYSFYDGTYGGGIWWKRDGTSPQKNMATNAPMVMTAVKLKNATGNTAYLTKAQNIYSWIQNRLAGNGKLADHVEGSGNGSVVDWDFSYNYGTYLGAALALYQATGTASYLTDANNAASYVINNMTLSNTPMYEGENDGAGFKMIFMRNLNQLRQATGNASYLNFLQQNATQAYNHRRASDQIIGSDWTGPTGAGYVQSLAAAAGASALQLVPADGYTGNIAGNGNYEAENTLLVKAGGGGILTESSTAGFSGRGYVAGWNTNGTAVKFNVNQNSASTRTVTIRYAAGAGNASRYVSVNGTVVQSNLSFAQTSGWGDWKTVTLSVNLQAGYNQIIIGYDASKGNTNYLNLDKIYGL
ncbi:glycoside hydrolase family 76 protein [Paenibacillus chibensis]|uniref:glycoside hydrolase family 76 protein n=1 Tax=Paenibacillus chibensis TaxID=59846 RepID=UPI000FDBB239|nr:glycoside hydrolase family 76 protein [Paenibacillus chibensis]MEC0368349.1 glycoside hydrolase family 76 protein [Paenibacillus chibensis]